MPKRAIIPYIDCARRRRLSSYVFFVDGIFLFCLLLGPFTHSLVDRETGEGAFVKYFYGVFFILALPIAKQYFAKWKSAFVMYFLILLFGFSVDISYFGLSDISGLLILLRQSSIGMLFAIVAYNMILRNPRYIRILTGVWMVSIIFSAISMVMGWGVVEGIEHGAEGVRYAVMGQNSNRTGQSMARLITFGVLLLVGAIPVAKKSKIMVLGVVPIALFALLKTSSRGATLVLLFAMLLISLTTRSIGKKMLYISISAMAVVVIVFSVMNSEMLRSRILNAVHERDTGGRERIWYIALEIWEKQPIFGAGMARHGREIAVANGEAYMKKVPVRATHNAYLRVLVGSGIVGFAFYLAALMFVGMAACRNRRLPYGNFYFICFFVSLLAGMSGNTETENWTFIVWALILGIDFHARKAKRLGIPLLEAR